MVDKTAMMLNQDGSSYHLHAFAQDIAPWVILVGDPERTTAVAQHFDTIESERSHREFVLKTGKLNGTRITVISTGIGTDNVDIVINELDLLVNVDLSTGKSNPSPTSLNIVRLGTSGATCERIALDSLVLSQAAFCFDDLIHYYHYRYSAVEEKLLTQLSNYFQKTTFAKNLYVSQASEQLLALFEPLGLKGITLSASGFYGPQGRALRAPLITPTLLDVIKQINLTTHNEITNLEMETAAIYALGRLLGHRCCSISVIVANRITGKISKNIKSAVAKMIEQALHVIISSPEKGG